MHKTVGSGISIERCHVHDLGDTKCRPHGLLLRSKSEVKQITYNSGADCIRCRNFGVFTFKPHKSAWDEQRILMKVFGLDVNLPERTRRFGLGRKHATRAGVVCAVFLAHILFFALLCWPLRSASPGETGAYGEVAFASLVPALSSSTPRSIISDRGQKDPKRADIAKPAAPIFSDLASELAVTEHSFDEPAIDPSSLTDTEPTLSDADALALSQFEPASAQGEPNTPCNLTPAMASDFAQNPLVRRGLDQLPSTQRSVANAIMMWDGSWSGETLAGGKAFLRALIVREVLAGRPECLEQVNHGPVFFFVPDGKVTAVVAIGSGDWTWGQLVEQ